MTTRDKEREQDLRLTGAGLPPPSWSPSKLTPQKRDEIRKRRADGELVRDLAAEFGVSAVTVRRNS